MATPSILGSGWQYPFAMNGDGGVQGVSEVDSVRASLKRLFDTAPGTEFMLPEYGCPMSQMVFEADTEVTRAIATTLMRDSVLRWEPRVAEIVDVQVNPDGEQEHVILFRIFFRLINSQKIENLVYPYTTVR